MKESGRPFDVRKVLGTEKKGRMKENGRPFDVCVLSRDS